MKELIGRKIIAYRFDNEGEKLIFTTDKGEIEYQTLADCCSRSFFSDVEGMDNLLGYVVNEVVERQEWTPEETKKAESWSDYESLSLYGYLLKTEKGTCDFEFRNNSNGYYGGLCDCVRDETRKNES